MSFAEPKLAGANRTDLTNFDLHAEVQITKSFECDLARAAPNHHHQADATRDATHADAREPGGISKVLHEQRFRVVDLIVTALHKERE